MSKEDIERTPDRSAGETVATLLALSSEEDGRTALQSALDELNKFLKPNSDFEVHELSLYTPATLSRFLQYYALSKMLARPGRRASDRPAKGATYNLLCKIYNEFQERFFQNGGADIRLLPTLEPGTVRDFCLLHTFSSGSETSRFYSALALFVADLAERDELRSDFFQKVLPSSEERFPTDLANWLVGRVKDNLSGAVTPQAKQLEKKGESDFLTISVNFSYGRHNKSELDDFISEFQIEEVDNCAHFICYRPRLSEPRELIKTFLTLKPSWALHGVSQSHNTNFSHFYAPPGKRNHHYHRISNGRAIPLDEGVYLIGGHKLRNRDRVPFRSVEAISFEWSYLKNTQAVFPALMISANNRDTHLATRIAVRATPLHHSTKVSIGAVGIDRLVEDVRADLEAEAKLVEEEQIKGFVGRQHLSKPDDASAISQSILDYCNNLPAKWRIDAEYVATAEETSETLTPRRMEAKLEEVFGSDEHPVFFNEDGQPFTFWESLRFGALSAK